MSAWGKYASANPLEDPSTLDRCINKTEDDFFIIYDEDMRKTGRVYCLPFSELNNLLKTRINPYTGFPLSKEFVRYLKDLNSVTRIRSLEKMVEADPEKDWDWYELSSNPNISLKFILQHPFFPWKWEIVTMNPNVTMKDIQMVPVLSWKNSSYLSRNSGITMEDVKENPDVEWDYSALSYNPNFTEEEIENEIIESGVNKWDHKALIFNPNISIDFLVRHFDIGEEIRERQSETSLKEIFEHSDLKWNWKTLSKDPRINAEFVASLPNKSWDWEYLTVKNPSIKWEDVRNYPELPWNFYKLSWNYPVDIEFINDHPDLNWNWESLSGNKYITLEDIERYSHLPWERSVISGRSSDTDRWENIKRWTKKMKWPFVELKIRPDPGAFLERDEEGGISILAKPGTGIDFLRKIVQHSPGNLPLPYISPSRRKGRSRMY